MPSSSRSHNDDEDDEEFDEDDLPEGVYLDDADEDFVGSSGSDGRTFPCPHCGHAVSQGASYCVRCEQSISREDSRGEHKPLWIWLCLFLALIAAVFWIIPF
jgi:predicted nucleic acid-binding Zn ribbon protein